MGTVQLKYSLYYFAYLRVSNAVINHHDQKHLGEERSYFTYTFISQSSTEESQDRNLQIGTELRPWRSTAYRLLPMAASACFPKAPNYQPRNGALTSELGPSTSIISPALPRIQSYGDILSVKNPSSQMCL